MTRRQLLLSAAAAPLAAATTGAVPPLDASKIRPADFSDPDLDLPYYLAHFARFANSVLMEGPDRGFISLSVWRNEKDNRPYNARIMENILSLAWFYTAERKWNPYRAHPAVRARLEAALDFWARMQDPDGRFSEYKPRGWNLAATAFAVKFLAEALRLLKSGPPLDSAVHARAVEACRKALRIVLYDDAFIRHGLAYSNQYTNVFAGGPAFLKLYPDVKLAARLAERMEASSTEFQSPAGYFYEADGPDFGYNLGTHHENVHMAYHYWRGTRLGDVLAGQEKRFCEWIAYNALPEPGQDFFVLNRAIETRQKHPVMEYLDTPVAERVPIARAFATPPEKRVAAIREQRRKLEAEWPRVDPLQPGLFWAYTPYRFLHRSHYEWHPTAEQIAEARKLAPPLAERSFVRRLRDTRHAVEFTYVRRPAYYAAFASGRAIREQQRFGLTLVWTPENGVLLQSQTASAEAAWGTVGGDRGSLEGAGVQAEHIDGGASLRYPLEGGGSKSVVFAADRIQVVVERGGEIVERVPVFDASHVVSQAARTLRPQGRSPVPGKASVVVELRASGRMEYDIRPA